MSAQLPGEHVVWSGRPDAHRRFDRADVLQAAAALIVLAWGAFWEHAVLTARTASGGHRHGPLFAGRGVAIAAFVVVGTVGRIVLRHRRRAVTAYRLTTARAIATVGGRDYIVALGPPVVRRSRDRRHVDVLWGVRRTTDRIWLYTALRPPPGLLIFAGVAADDGVTEAVAALGLGGRS